MLQWRMAAVAAGLSGERRPGQQRLAPHGDETLAIAIARERTCGRARWRYSAAPGSHVNPRPRTMRLHSRRLQRAAEGRPVRIALVRAGNFGSMSLAHALSLPGPDVVGVSYL